MTRLRNEALVLPDTLSYLGKEVDAIIAYDDASTDRRLDILRAHPKVALIVANGSWEEDIKARRLAEGRHRGLLLDRLASIKLGARCSGFRSGLSHVGRRQQSYPVPRSGNMPKDIC
jgi:hypothetical protein